LITDRIDTAGHGFSRAVMAALKHCPALLLCLLVAACRQDMHDQPKYEPLEASNFFDNGAASRPLVEGTVARGQLREDAAFYSGQAGGVAVAKNPLPIDAGLLDRGQERYDIFCSPCHDRAGNGNGIVIQRGYRQPPALHIDRLRDAPDGQLYHVITNGFGAMPDYRAQIPVRDRWAIVAYVRALQLSQRAPLSDVPEAERSKIRELK
jgi:mono/diheme cytochrome c family protein